jgi:simple sugar transport system substrate-binding protein
MLNPEIWRSGKMSKILNKKSLLVLGIAALIGSFFVAAPASAKPPFVGVANQWLGNDWNAFGLTSIEARFKELGIKYQSTNSMGDTSRQIADVENFITMGADAIIIKGGLGDAFRDVAKKAYDKNIPVVTVEMMLPYAVSNVMTDNWTGSTLMGNWTVQMMRGSGKMIIMDTVGWHPLEVRKMVQKTCVHHWPIEIVSEHETGVDAPIENSYNIVKSVLRAHPDLKLVFATWGLPMVGAYKAVKEMGLRDQVIIAGTDSDRPVLKVMAAEDAPRMACMGARPTMLGYIAANLVEQAIKIGDVKKAKEALLPEVFAPLPMVTNVYPKKDFPQIATSTSGAIAYDLNGLWNEQYLSGKYGIKTYKRPYDATKIHRYWSKKIYGEEFTPVAR